MSWKARLIGINTQRNDFKNVSLEIEYFDLETNESFREIFSHDVERELESIKQIVINKIDQIESFKNKVKKIKEKELDKEIKKEKPKSGARFILTVGNPILK